MEAKFDVLVIGGGAGGFVSAKFANGLGKKVAMIEKERLGGECTWTGCVPSKALIHAASSSAKVENVMNHVRSVRERVYNSHPPESFEALGIKIIMGAPTFVNDHTVRVNDTTISAKKIILATGSSPFVPPPLIPSDSRSESYRGIEGLDTVPYLTNNNFFDLEKLPESLVIMGGGPIGVELACALNKFGVRVTVVEMQEHVLAREDKQLAELLQEKMRGDGITILTGNKVVGVAKREGGVVATCEDNFGKKTEVSAQRLLVATGRKPNVDGLGLEAAGVAYDRLGITVNKYLQTSAKHIYACGDVVGPYQFSHMAEYQAVVATRNALLPFKKKVDYDKNKIWVTFCDPELASCGMNELEVRERYGDRIRLYKIEYKTIDRAMTDSVDFGLAKFVCDRKGRLLGAQVLGPRAGEVVHEVQVARRHGISLAKLDSVIHAYPTYCDVTKKAARLCRVELLRDNFFIKLFSRLLKK